MRNTDRWAGSALCSPPDSQDHDDGVTMVILVHSPVGSISDRMSCCLTTISLEFLFRHDAEGLSREH